MEYSDVSSTFTQLADTHFVQRCPVVEEKDGTEGRRPPIPSLVTNEKEMFSVPRVLLVGRGKRRRSSDEDEGAGQSKRPKKDSDTSQDDGIYWQINTERFHQHFRDQAIISAVSNKMDQTSSEIVRTMLRMSEVTTSSNAAHTQPLSSNEAPAGEVSEDRGDHRFHAGHGGRGGPATGDRGDDHSARTTAAGEPQTQRQ
ncbi:hypothetical protein AB205_0152570, partial [Aquarana catesbeiana]